MLLVIISSLLLSGLAATQDPVQEFAKFKTLHGKSYSSLAEEEVRFGHFKENLAKISAHNSEGHSWRLGVTKFADLSKEEFVKTYSSGNLNMRKFQPQADLPVERKEIRLEDLPAEVDWRDQGVITSVRDQGRCGSCWAFASSSVMGSYAKISDMSHDLLELSPQQLVSCAPNPLQCGGAGGCQGSVEPLAFTYVSLFGAITEDDYPYESDHGANDDICKFDARATDASVMVRGWETLPTNDMLAVMDHLANKGPLSTSVAASDWSLYSGGVFDGCDYDSDIVVNHAVLLVGYGTDPTDGDYWLIKNSWGTGWGDTMTDGNAGFIKLRRRSEPMCGTDYSPLDGSGCVDGGVDSVYVCGTCAVLSGNSYPIGTQFLK